MYAPIQNKINSIQFFHNFSTENNRKQQKRLKYFKVCKLWNLHLCDRPKDKFLWQIITCPWDCRHRTFDWPIIWLGLCLQRSSLQQDLTEFDIVMYSLRHVHVQYVYICTVYMPDSVYSDMTYTLMNQSTTSDQDNVWQKRLVHI